jgi:hypothetical protein
MARSHRSPAVLMTVYVGIFLYAGPWLATGSAPERNVPQVVVAVLLAVLAARGSRAARVLMITATGPIEPEHPHDVQQQRPTLPGHRQPHASVRAS